MTYKTTKDTEGTRTVGDATFLKPDEYPPPRGSKVLLLTTYGTIVIGTWRDEDCKQWHPLLRENRT